MMNRLMSNALHAVNEAVETADRNGTPVMVLSRNGWYAICEEPPDDMDPSPYDEGWQDHALVEPTAWDAE